MNGVTKPPRRPNSMRWRAGDYSQPRSYYVTICAQEMQCLFGSVRGARTVLNDAGAAVGRVWESIPTQFPAVRLDSWVLMPNHLHGIVRILEAVMDRPRRARPSLPDVVHFFKSKSTSVYARGVRDRRWPPFPGRLWQRGYYDRVIRDDDELSHARGYIGRNPIRWQESKRGTP